NDSRSAPVAGATDPGSGFSGAASACGEDLSSDFISGFSSDFGSGSASASGFAPLGTVCGAASPAGAPSSAALSGRAGGLDPLGALSAAPSRLAGGVRATK